MRRVEREMRREYDFSGGVRGKFYRPRKVQKTLRLDEDIVKYFQARARTEAKGDQTLINEALRRLIGRANTSEARLSLRRLIAEEVRRELAKRRRQGAAA